MGHKQSQLQAEVLQQQRCSTPELSEVLQAMIIDDNLLSVNDEQVKHAWDPDDCSDNFTVLPDKVTARRGEKTMRTDLIRGKKAYVSGTHVFEIFWPRNERGSQAMIGMATQNAPMSCVGYSHLLGLTSDSWGWSLVDKRLVHDGWECGIYPSDRSDYEVPDKFYVILNADDGTLRFEANDEDLGIAFTDLPHQDPSKALCISAGATCDNGDVRMIYIGTELTEKDEGVDSASTKGEVKSEINGTDPNAIMFAMRETVELLANGSEVDIFTAVEKVRETIMVPLGRTSDERLLRRFGDHLASLGGGHELTKLLQRLQQIGDRNPNEQSWFGINVLRKICTDYSSDSLKLCKQFGQSGLLELMLKDIDRFGPTKVTNEKRYFLVKSAIFALHNCAKATENKQVYRDIRAIERIAPYMKSKYLLLGMAAMLTLSYVTEDNKIDLLTADKMLIAVTLGVLKKTLDDPRLQGNVNDHEFSALEITTGLGNIAVNDTNKDLIVELGGVQLLIDLLKKDRPDVQESAANALWTLAQAERHRGNITSIPGAISTLTSLCRSTNTAVKQAAERALIRIKSSSQGQQILVGSRPTSASRGHCSYRELCGRFKKSLELQDAFFEPKFDMCYCTSCHNDRGDKLYYTRGQPAKDYGVPFGWCRFALKTPPKASALDVFNKWHVAFHGTRLQSVKPILETGDFLMPGDVRMGGAKLSECDGHFSDDRKPKGFDTKQIFLSPSIRYSGCDVYASESEFTDKSTNKSHQARVVFQVCINPTSYKVGPQTIGATSEIDPKFSNQEIEWFTKERGSVIPYGLLVKIE
ncbi:uncharacterized protein [Ptychodera flava]|uniref:uncharacterized protein n=1 Tax=Ptychodera flava TaxID=63121 RepID=UPI00396A6FBF